MVGISCLSSVVVSITAEGAVRRSEEEMESVVRDVVAGRTENPGG